VLSGLATLIARLVTRTLIRPPYDPGPDAARLHRSLEIADLHADPLLWGRNLLERGSWGHVDLPRLREGNVAVQVFGVVTGVPFPLRMDNNRDRGDLIGLLARLQGWPKEARRSRLQRALYLASMLSGFVDGSDGGLRLLGSVGDLESLIADRTGGAPTVGGVLSLEGAHGLEGDPENVDTLFHAGFRMLGLVHMMDNEMAGSAHGIEKHGLTPTGREAVRRALERGMVLDLAHASPRAIDDVLAMVDRPVVSSHGGVRGTCDSVRNLADEHVRGIAATGGVIGIGLYEFATGGKTIEATVRAMGYVADLVGIEYVALGSDFDGAATVVDATGLPMLSQGLLHEGFSEDDVAAIMGGNALRVLRETLP
jgi:microsomal dipeptidase-like Zn-dependent dipeptidase